MRDHDAPVMKDEVKFASRRIAGMGWLRTDIGAEQIGARKKSVQFRFAEERVEVAGNHHRVRRRVDKLLQIMQLALPVPIAQRKVHQEDRQVFEFKLDDQALHTARKEVKSFTVHRAARDEGVALLVEYGNKTVQGVVVVLALVYMRIVAECSRYGFGLVAPLSRAKGTEIHFDKSEYVGVQRFEKMNQAL